MLQLLGWRETQGPVATRRSPQLGELWAGAGAGARAGSRGGSRGCLAALRDARFLFAVQLHARVLRTGFLRAQVEEGGKNL